MNAPSISPLLSVAPASFTQRAILCNLIRQEWRLCRGPVLALGVVWLVGLWILVLFQHPAWLIAIGLWHVLFVSPAQAGRDIIDGIEEFSFALPPGRSPLYVARMTPGLVFLAAIGLLGWLAIAYNLPQRLWSLVFSSGLTEPFAPVTGGHWFGMAVVLPCAAHAVACAVAANAGSRATVSSSGIIGIVAAGGVMLGGLYLENLLWQETNGFLAGTALLGSTVSALFVGHQAYCRKEATGSGGAVATASRRGLLWGIAVVVILLISLLAGMFLLKSTAVRTDQEMNRRECERREQQMLKLKMQAPTMPTPAPSPDAAPH